MLEKEQFYNSLPLPQISDFIEEKNDGVIFHTMGDLFRDYKYIKGVLEIKVKVAEKKVKIIKDCNLEHRYPDSEEQKILGYPIFLTSNELSLILQGVCESKAAKGVRYDPILISNLESLQILTEDICKNYYNDEIIRRNIILMSTVHAFPISIFYGKASYSIYGCDSADIPMGPFFTVLFKLANPGRDIENSNKDIKGELHYKNLNTLTIVGDCTKFAVQNLNTIFKLEQDELIEFIPKIGNSMTKLPIPYKVLKNTQTIQGLKKIFPSQLPEDLKNYIDRYSLKINDESIQNRAIDYKQYEYLTLALQVLESANIRGGEECVQQVLQQRTGNKILDSDKITVLNFESNIDGYIENECELIAMVKDLDVI